MPTTQEISNYVTGLSSATLDGTEEVYLATDEKTTVNAISQFTVGRQWKAQVGQSGASAPTLNVLVNTLGITAVPFYTIVGGYRIEGFDSNLTGDWEVIVNFNFNDTAYTKSYTVAASSSSILNFATYVSGVQTDGVIQSSPTAYYTITINKYD